MALEEVSRGGCQDYDVRTAAGFVLALVMLARHEEVGATCVVGDSEAVDGVAMVGAVEMDIHDSDLEGEANAHNDHDGVLLELNNSHNVHGDHGGHHGDKLEDACSIEVQKNDCSLVECNNDGNAEDS